MAVCTLLGPLRMDCGEEEEGRGEEGGGDGKGYEDVWEGQECILIFFFFFLYFECASLNYFGQRDVPTAKK